MLQPAFPLCCWRGNNLWVAGASPHEKPTLKTQVDVIRPQATSHGLPLGASVFTAFLCFLFGANAVAVKISLTGLGVFTTAGLRFAAAAVVLCLYAILTGKPLAVKRGLFGHMAVLAAIFFTQLSLFYFGQAKTTASHGTLISNILPFMVMLLAHVFIPGETIRRHRILGLLVGFAGVAVLFFDNLAVTGQALEGDLLILTAVMIWSGHVIYIKKIISHYDPLQITLYPMAMAAPVFLVSGFLFDGEMIGTIDATIVQAMLYQIFVTASFGFVAWNTLISRYGAAALHAFIFIMPISGVLLGVVMLEEPLTVNLISAIVLVVTGLILVNRTKPLHDT